MRSELIKTLDKAKINDVILREFVHKELWSAAMQACSECITRRQQEIIVLEKIKVEMEDFL